MTAGNIDNVGFDEVIVGADTGGGPRVRTFNIVSGTAFQMFGPLGNFFAFDPSFTGGVRVAAGNFDGNPPNGAELAVAAGPGGGPHVKLFSFDGVALASFFVFDLTFTGGLQVAAVPFQFTNRDRLVVTASTGQVRAVDFALNGAFTITDITNPLQLGNLTAVTFTGRTGP